MSRKQPKRNQTGFFGHPQRQPRSAGAFSIQDAGGGSRDEVKSHQTGLDRKLGACRCRLLLKRKDEFAKQS